MYCNNNAAYDGRNASHLLTEAYEKMQKKAEKCHNGMSFSVFFPSAATAAAASAGEGTRLEEMLSHDLHIAHVHKTASHDQACLLALLTLASPILGERSLRPGDEVITVGLDAAAVRAIQAFGAVPVLVDVALPHYSIDAKELERALSPGTRAVMLSHTLGYPFSLKTVRNFCNDYELWLVEDSAPALGAAYDFDGTRYATGTVGDIGIGSLSPLSPDGTGCGTLYTRDDALSAIAAEILQSTPSLSADPLQADLDAARLAALPQVADARRRAAARLWKALQPVADHLVLPEALPNTHPAPLAFPFTCKEGANAGALLEKLRQQGVPCCPFLSAEEASLLASVCASGGCRPVGDLPVTRRILSDTLLIPLPLGMTDEALAQTAAAILEALA